MRSVFFGPNDRKDHPGHLGIETLKSAGTRTTVACPTWLGQLSTRCEAFRTRCAAHDVRFHDTGSSTSITLSSATSP